MSFGVSLPTGRLVISSVVAVPFSVFVGFESQLDTCTYKKASLFMFSCFLCSSKSHRWASHLWVNHRGQHTQMALVVGKPMVFIMVSPQWRYWVRGPVVGLGTPLLVSKLFMSWELQADALWMNLGLQFSLWIHQWFLRYQVLLKWRTSSPRQGMLQDVESDHVSAASIIFLLRRCAFRSTWLFFKGVTYTGIYTVKCLWENQVACLVVGGVQGVPSV